MVYPQQIKITGQGDSQDDSHFCLFKLTKEYLKIRGDYQNVDEPFFVFRDKSPVRSNMVRTLLKKIIKRINLNERFFNCHSFRTGRCCDLLKEGVPIEQIQLMGRWKSNTVFRYFKN